MMNNQLLASAKRFVKRLFKTKSPDELIAEGEKSELSKSLTVFDLIIIGIGASIS